MRSRLLATALAITVVTASCQPAGHTFSDADMATARASSDTFVARLMRKDWPGVVSMYTTNDRFLPPNQKAVIGRAAMQTWLTALPPLAAFALKPDTIVGSGDLVYLQGHFALTFAPPGAPPIVDSGKYVEVHQRQADGTWLSVVDMFNSDLPAMPAPAPKKK